MDEQLILETPEQVEVSFELAGPASRAIACLLDTLLQALIILLTLIGLGLLGVLNQTDVDTGLSSLESSASSSQVPQIPVVLMAIVGIVAFAVFWGYHVFFEMVTGGRTPGKQLMGLRVLRDTGTPVTFSESFVRNLVRVIDFLPIYYGAGLAAMLLNRKGKRLGDLAAGTIVVRERKLPDTLPRPRLSSPAGQLRLEPRVEALIASFLERRDALAPDRRETLARQIARPLQARHGGREVPPEAFLETLLLVSREGSKPPWAPREPELPGSRGLGWAESSSPLPTDSSGASWSFRRTPPEEDER